MDIPVSPRPPGTLVVVGCLNSTSCITGDGHTIIHVRKWRRRNICPCAVICNISCYCSIHVAGLATAILRTYAVACMDWTKQIGNTTAEAEVLRRCESLEDAGCCKCESTGTIATDTIGLLWMDIMASRLTGDYSKPHRYSHINRSKSYGTD